MASMTWHETLRAQLVDALRAVDPDAPTLCEGWQARHLAAHVVLRESSVTVGAGLAVPALAGAAERAIDELAQTATTPQGYADLVGRVAAGPPRWHPLSLAGDAANLVEFYVHGEDVRRGAGPAPDRDLDPGLVDALWKDVRRFARARTHRVPVGLVLVRADGPRTRVKGAKGDHGTVVVRGGAGELVLWLSGRGAASTVLAQGSPDDVAALAQRFPLP
ncbi:TIGR03085 family protein OS=Cellulomonas persica OX=76861 GN=CPE01_24360 PE=4 SV=1 [Cellulomonas persica]